MLDLNKILAQHAAWLRDEPEGQRAALRWANLRGVDLREADLRGAILREADLSGVNLRWANLSEANLRGADLCGADLRRADLCGADLREASLSEANLRGANLRGVDLSEADLRGADLRWANLSEADLREASLCGANLSGRIPLHADTARRYVLYVIPETRSGPRFVAGCRNFTAAEALSHWGPGSPSSQPEYVAAIKQWLADNGLTDVVEDVE